MKQLLKVGNSVFAIILGILIITTSLNYIFIVLPRLNELFTKFSVQTPYSHSTLQITSSIMVIFGTLLLILGIVSFKKSKYLKLILVLNLFTLFMFTIMFLRAPNLLQIVESVNTVSQEKTIVPLPNQIDTIQLFFTLIDEGKTDDVIKMMYKPEGDWTPYFENFESVKITSINEEKLEPITPNLYRVEFDVVLNPNTQDDNAACPNFCYNNGANTRWLELVQEKSLWKIKNINTGP